MAGCRGGDMGANPMRTKEPTHKKIRLRGRIMSARKARVQLRRSEERFKAIFEHAPIMIDSFDENGHVLLWNRECVKTLGWTEEEMRNADDPLALFYPSAEVRVRVLETIKRADGRFREYEVVAKDGAKRRQMWADFRLPDGARISFGLDITDQRETEQAFREREEFLGLIVRQIPAVLWSTDENLRFTSSFGSGLQSLRLEPNEVVGKTLFEYFQTDDAGFLPIAMHRRALEGGAAAYEVSWNGRDFESHTQPLRDGNGKIIGTLGIALDITQRKKVEAALRDRESQLRALTARLRTIREEESANIAREIHDELGQSLTGLKMDVSWVRRRIKGDGAGEIKKRLSSMSRAIDETVRIVRRISTQLRPVILDDLGLMKALDWQAQEFENRTGIRCHTIAQEAEIEVDRRRSTAIFRIFQEILTNVARHSGARNVHIDLARDDGIFLMSVKDDGKGISESDLKGPTALGILSMQERAQECGGEVVIERDAGGGTRVGVQIPLD